TLLLSRENGSLPRAVPKLTRPAEGDMDTVAENPHTRPVSADARVQWAESGRGGAPPLPYGGFRRRTLAVTLIVRLEGPGKRRWDTMGWSPLFPPAAQAASTATETHDTTLMHPVELSLPSSSAPGSRPGSKPGSAAAPLRSN